MKTAQQGFTLIELVIVLVILGILAAVAAPQFGQITGTADRSSAQALGSSISSATAANYAESRVNPGSGDVEAVSSCDDETEISRLLGEADDWLEDQFGGLTNSSVADRDTDGEPGDDIFCQFGDFSGDDEFDFRVTLTQETPEE